MGGRLACEPAPGREAVGNELRVATLEIFSQLLGMDTRTILKRGTARLAECMRVLGWAGPKRL
jgi:hypothetical protein